MRTTISACRTAWGWVGTAASSIGLLGTTLPKASREQALASLLNRWPLAQEGKESCLAAVHDKLQRYFGGKVVGFGDTVLDVRGATDFQIRVSETVRAIPRGQVRSYGWLAHQAGFARAARAVGRAMSDNPLPIVVPPSRRGKGLPANGFR